MTFDNIAEETNALTIFFRNFNFNNKYRENSYTIARSVGSEHSLDE